jgi:tetratricopeptide (TPR) repeat protein
MMRCCPVFAVALVTTGALAAWSPVSAQRNVEAVLELGGLRLAVSAQEMRALSHLGNVLRSGQKGVVDRALADAQRVSNSRDAQYALALYELEIGRRRGDDAMRAKALDLLIASALAPRDKLAGNLAARGQIAYKAGDLETADRVWARLTELTPNNADAFANLAQVRLAQKHPDGAIKLLARAIEAREASGQPIPAAWYRQRLIIAHQGSLLAPGIDAAKALVSAYPTAENWRTALVIYRQMTAPDGALEIDLHRLMRHVGVLAQANEYHRMAQLLWRHGEPSEAKAVLNEGIGRGLLDAQTSPTREIMREADREVAKQRGGSSSRPEPPSPAAAQVRLGVSQLLAGRRAEADATFRSAAGGQGDDRYADLAHFWLAFLAQGQPASASAAWPSS